MLDSAGIKQVQDAIGYTFKNPQLLSVALTHPSALGEGDAEHSYERLEFLGDSIVGAVAAHLLFLKFPDLDEGKLTQLKISLVAGSTLSVLSKKMGLGEYIVFGNSEIGTESRGMTSALENVYESIAGAIWLDGGYDEVVSWVERTLSPALTDDITIIPDNPKSMLQEYIQRDFHETPVYQLMESTGPAHKPRFTSSVLRGHEILGTGSGGSKKESESAAALNALHELGYIKPDSSEEG